MDVVFPRGEIVDNSMATDKQQHKAFLAFMWGQENTCCSEMKWITKYLAVVEHSPGWPGVQKAQCLLLHCSGWCIWIYISVCVCVSSVKMCLRLLKLQNTQSDELTFGLTLKLKCFLRSISEYLFETKTNSCVRVQC